MPLNDRKAALNLLKFLPSSTVPDPMAHLDPEFEEYIRMTTV